MAENEKTIEKKDLKELDKEEKSSWGGHREGSGRKPLMKKEHIEEIKLLISQHAMEIDEDDLEKRERIFILMEQLYQAGKKGNVVATKEYLDRQMGKSKESLDVTTNGKEINNTSYEQAVKIIRAGEGSDKSDSPE